MKGLEEVFIVAWIVFGLYMLVFMAVGTDLWSGVRKALKDRVDSDFAEWEAAREDESVVVL